MDAFEAWCACVRSSEEVKVQRANARHFGLRAVGRLLGQVAPERLAGLNARLRGVRVGDFELVERSLHLGETSGNHFQVTLRDVAGATVAEVLPTMLLITPLVHKHIVYPD